MAVKTGFVKVAQSGETIDGRQIEPGWLIEAAKSYSKDIYTANIFPEHWDWAYNYGYVDSLDYSEDENGVVSLFANLSPNSIWLDIAKHGQRLFTSIALKSDFPEQGQHYLYSLAATNNPASIGVEQLQFSKKDPNTFYLESVEMTAKPKKKSNKSFSFFKKNKEPTMPDPNPELEKIEKRIADMEKNFSTPQIDKTGDNKKFNDLKSENDELQKKFSKLEDENKALKQQLDDSEKEFSSFKDQFNTLKKDFDKAVAEPSPGSTQYSQHTSVEATQEGIV